MRFQNHIKQKGGYGLCNMTQKKEREKQILECFDKVFDAYNSKTVTKEYMLKKCKFLHSLLPTSKTVKKGS